MSREDEKRVFPQKFSKDIEALFDDKDAFSKLKKSLCIYDREEQLKELPESLSEKTIKGVITFIETHEQDQIIDPMEKLLTELTENIDKKKARLSVIRPKDDTKKDAERSGQSKKGKVPAKKTTPKMKSQSFDDLSAEERFRNLIQEVNERVQAVKLEKDDFKTYSELQSEIDTFMGEAITEITSIKTNFKKKFDAVQKGR